MSDVLKDSYLKPNRNLAHKFLPLKVLDKTTRRREKQNSFSGSNFYAVIFFAEQRTIKMQFKGMLFFEVLQGMTYKAFKYG